MKQPREELIPTRASLIHRLKDWQDNSSWANVTAVYRPLAGGARGGLTAQQIDVSAVINGAVQVYQPAPVTKGRLYRFSVWLRGTPGTHGLLRIQTSAAPYTSFADTSFVLQDAWRRYTAEGYVTDTTTALLIVGVRTPGTIIMDNATLDYVAGAPQPVLPVGPVSAKFFGMHVANFQYQTLHNADFNGTFEPIVNTGLATLAGELASNWNDNSEWAPVSVAYSADTVNPHSAPTSQKVQVLAVPSGQVQFVQSLSLKPGSRYTFSVWLRGATGNSVDVVLRDRPAPFTYYAAQTVALTPIWTKTSVTGVVGDTGQTFVMIAAPNPGTFWVDDAQVVDALGQPVTDGIPWPTKPIGTLRLWDAGVHWHNLSPHAGVYNFDQLDAWVAAAQAHGNPDIVLTLGQSPAWASARPNERSYNGAGAPAEPRSIADWKDYVQRVATRYRGRIRYYEIWNEPNDPDFYSGTVEKMVELTNAAAQVLKAVDPANIVISPPPYTAGYLDQFLTAGGGAAVDIIAYHVYATPPEAAAPALAEVRLVLARHNVTKPLWDSEGASGNLTTPASLGAAFLARKYLVDLVYGAQRFDWYTWGPATDFCVATVNNDAARTTNRAGVAYGVLQGWLVGATVTSAVTDASGNWLIGLTLAGGARAAIVWNPLGSTNAVLPGGLSATQRVDLAGLTSAVSGGVVTATVEPALFR